MTFRLRSSPAIVDAATLSNIIIDSSDVAEGAGLTYDSASDTFVMNTSVITDVSTPRTVHGSFRVRSIIIGDNVAAPEQEIFHQEIVTLAAPGVNAESFEIIDVPADANAFTVTSYRQGYNATATPLLGDQLRVSVYNSQAVATGGTVDVAVLVT